MVTKQQKRQRLRFCANMEICEITYMKPKIILGLALVLRGVMATCSEATLAC